MNGRHHPGIVRRLVAVTLFAGLATGLLGAVVVQLVERRSVIADAEARNLAAAVRLASLIDDHVEALAGQLELIATRPEVHPQAEGAEDELAIALRASDHLDLLAVHDLDGTAVAANATDQVVAAVDLLDRTADPETGRSATLEPEGERTHVVVTVAIEDPPGTIVGWLVGATPLALLSSELSGDPLAPGTSAAIVAADGTIVAHREFDRVITQERLDVDALFAGDVRTARITRNGEDILLGASRLRAVSGWLVVEQPRATALAPVRERTGIRTVVLLAVLLSVVAVVVWTGRRLLRPLEPLAAAVEDIGAGRRDVRIDVDAVGEVAALADGIDRMARSLTQRESELRHAEAAARESEERFRLLVEGVTDHAIVLLAPDRTIRTWNSGARRLLGHAPAEAVGRRLTDMFDPDDPPDDPFFTAQREDRAEVEGWCRRADGSRFWASIAASQLHDDGGRPYGFAVILRDLTARREARRAIEVALEREQQAAAELRRASELKDEFLAVAAHEIRTPLSVILGASRLLGRDAATLSDDDADRLRAMLERHADDLRRIIDRLMDYTRLQAGKVRLHAEPVDLEEELTAQLQATSEAADHELTIEVEPATIRIDREALGHIVRNLVSNAAKFSPPGSAITIRGSCVEGLALEVADQGVGVAIEDRDRIFELFRQGTRDVITARGAGIGLAIVKRYVELLAGSITVESTPGEGSRFIVRLPLVAPDPPDEGTDVHDHIGG